MKRIGVVACKMAKGNLFLYNSFVLILVFLSALLLFFVAGLAIVLALGLIGYVVQGIFPPNYEKEWISVIVVCMISLTIAVSLFAATAISKNIKIR